MRARWPFALALALWTMAAARDRLDDWIAATDLPMTLTETSVEMRDRDRRLLRAYPVEDGLWRLGTDAARVDAGFLAMLLRYEDKRFHEHAGVDPRALLRAGVQAVRHGRIVSGGSTLTMQVARLLEDGPTDRWSGKLRQMRVALALERRLDKDAILSLYLTHAPYGGNLEGLRAATFAWFGKEPARLTEAQAALLVALPQAPEARRPDRAPLAARAARDRVVARMVRHGALDAETARAAMTEPVPTSMRPFPQLAAHLADRLRADDPAVRRHDLTLDAGLQQAMERLVRDAARRAGARLSAALVVADHETGAILASVGSPAYDDAGGRQGFNDMSRAARSPGSTLKPVIYALAFDQGLAHPETLIHDGPVQFDSYAPQNFDGRFRGDVTVREALQMSLNIPVVRLTEALGPARVMTALRRSGAEPALAGQPGLAIALGGLGLSLVDLVQLYAAFPRGGAGPRLHARAGAGGQTERLISPEAAWHLGDILSGLAPPPGAPRGGLAYKTGTSYGHRDAWALGYDGRHVVGVWMGRADGTPVPGAFGGDLAAPILFEAFGRLKPEFEPLPPPPPATLIVGGAALPPPLRRFRPRDAAFDTPEGALQVTFPPDGARLAPTGGDVTLKLRGGAAPFAVMADGRPVASGLRKREVLLPSPGPGYSTLVVIDADGRSARVRLRLDNAH